VQVAEVDKGVGEIPREVMLVMAIKEGVMREVIHMGEQEIRQPKWSTCSSLSANTFPFQDLSGI